MRFDEDELRVIQSTFKDNDKLLKVLRKIFLPEIDPFAPIGQLVDLWMVQNYDTMPPDEVKIQLIARNKLIAHVESQLLQIQLLAAMKDETLEEREKREKKDSSK